MTVVTRESEWTDRDRDEMIALRRYEAGVGPCGFHHSQTNDPEFWYVPEEEFCQACADLTMFERIKHAEHEKQLKALGENPPPDRQRPSDGRRTLVRLMTPAEIEAEKARQAT